MLRYLLPSVVDTSGAGIKRTIVINEKGLNHKIKQTTVIQIVLRSMLPSVGVVSGAKKSTMVRNGNILEHKKKTSISSTFKISLTFCSSYLWS